MHMEIGQPVTAHHHGTPLGIKRLYDFPQGVLIGIDIVAIELHGKTAAFRMHHTLRPATADSQIGPLRNDMDQSLVRCKTIDLRRVPSVEWLSMTIRLNLKSAC